MTPETPALELAARQQFTYLQDLGLSLTFGDILAALEPTCTTKQLKSLLQARVVLSYQQSHYHHRTYTLEEIRRAVIALNRHQDHPEQPWPDIASHMPMYIRTEGDRVFTDPLGQAVIARLFHQFALPEKNKP